MGFFGPFWAKTRLLIRIVLYFIKISILKNLDFTKNLHIKIKKRLSRKTRSVSSAVNFACGVYAPFENGVFSMTFMRSDMKPNYSKYSFGKLEIEIIINVTLK